MSAAKPSRSISYVAFLQQHVNPESNPTKLSNEPSGNPDKNLEPPPPTEVDPFNSMTQAPCAPVKGSFEDSFKGSYKGPCAQNVLWPESTCIEAKVYTCWVHGTLLESQRSLDFRFVEV